MRETRDEGVPAPALSHTHAGHWEHEAVMTRPPGVTVPPEVVVTGPASQGSHVQDSSEGRGKCILYTVKHLTRKNQSAS